MTSSNFGTSRPTNEAPAFSMAIVEGDKICIRIDEGKFLDTTYVYGELRPTDEGVLTYKTQINQLLVNGVMIDHMQLEHKFPEIQADFLENVTSPVLNELMVMLHAESEPATEIVAPSNIILS